MCLNVLVPVTIIIKLVGIQILQKQRTAGGQDSAALIGLDCEQITRSFVFVDGFLTHFIGQPARAERILQTRMNADLRCLYDHVLKLTDGGGKLDLGEILEMLLATEDFMPFFRRE